MGSSSFDKLLVANRGEIAARIIRSARALGWPTVAVYSDADAGAPHVALADEAVRIGGAPARESYLNAGALLDAARRTGANALHPGYGFLAENAQFAAACAFAGVSFVGPSPEAIELMGDKARAKARMEEAGVPTVPGWRSPEGAGEQTDDAIVAAAAGVGFPLLVKAAAGGGGRGMRRVDRADDLPAALASARAEASAAFGDGTLLLERLVDGARHVEVQVFGDAHGGAVHLFERDCSVQRRYQKVIEEAPSPAVDDALRARMGEAAVAAVRAIGYVGAGTVELLLGADGEFYFLEMNTRLQVEHPVTEMITGLDLVAWQLRVASGERLPLEQDALERRGHAIEVRLYAEDPYEDHRPQTGRVVAWEPAEGEGLRCDHGLRAGAEVSAHYDPMVAKLVAWGEDREHARRRILLALRDTVLLGIASNKRFLAEVIRQERFVAGEATTRWLETDLDRAVTTRPASSRRIVAIAAALWTVGLDGHSPAGDGPVADGWRSSGSADAPLTLIDGAVKHELRVRATGPGRVAVSRPAFPDAPETIVRVLARSGPRIRVAVDGVATTAHAAREDGRLHVEVDLEQIAVVEHLPGERGREAVAGDGNVRAPSAASVTTVDVAVGDPVEADTRVAALEAMKIETVLTAGVAGTVAEVRVAAGDQCKRKQVLIVVTPAADG